MVTEKTTETQPLGYSNSLKPKRSEMEAGVRIELTNRSFADSRLTTWLTRPAETTLNNTTTAAP